MFSAIDLALPHSPSLQQLIPALLSQDTFVPLLDFIFRVLFLGEGG